MNCNHGNTENEPMPVPFALRSDPSNSNNNCYRKSKLANSRRLHTQKLLLSLLAVSPSLLLLLLPLPYRDTRNPSSQKVVRKMTSDEPGRMASSVAPDGKAGTFSLTTAPNGPSRVDKMVDSSGLVVSTLTRIPSDPSGPMRVARVVITEVANPPNVATLTLDTSRPVPEAAFQSMY